MKVKLNLSCRTEALITGLVLAICSFTSNAEEWLVRMPEPLYQQQFSSMPVLYDFINNDKLIRVNGDQDDLNSLFKSSGIKYISQDITLASQPDLIAKARATAENSQDGVKSDGFAALSLSERQCDGVLVAVLDSGVDTLHQALNHVHFISPYNAIKQDDDVSDVYGHGTHVTGILAANSALGTAGACTSATIMPIRFLTAYGGGNISDAIAGIQWAIDHGASIINHSWTVTRYSQALFDVMQDANSKNIVQIVAAGNSSQDLERTSIYPAKFAASLPGMISVANWDNQYEKLNTSSNFGFSTVDIAASGTLINSLAPNDQSNIQSGTSMSAPLVTATAAMIRQRNISKTNVEVRAQILNAADEYSSLTGKVRDERKLNAKNAVTALEVAPILLTAKRDPQTVMISGYQLEALSDWRYQPATEGSQAYDLTPLSIKPQQVVFANWDMPVGWFEASTNTGDTIQFAFTTPANPPSNLQVSEWQEGKILTWQGSDYAEEYIVYRSTNGYPFSQIATVPAPANQYLDTQITADAIYKVRLKYSYQLNDKEYTVTSGYSEASSNAVTDATWLTQHLGKIPVGREARFPMLVDISSDDNPMIVIDDPQQLISNIDNRYILTINTGTVKQGDIALSVVGSAQGRIFTVSITDDKDWSLDYSETLLSFVEEGIKIESLQLRSDNSVLITGRYVDSQAMLHIVSDDPDYNFEQPEASLNQQQLLEEKLIASKQSLSISLDSAEEQETFWLEVSPNLARNSLVKASSGDTRCFIASAIYAEQPGKIQHFRKIRDDYLLTNQVGKWFVKQYYQYSPKLVVELKESTVLSILTTWLLDVAFYFSVYPWLFIIALLIFLQTRSYVMGNKRCH